MKTDVETLSSTRVRLTIEVPFDELQSSLNEAYRKVAQQVRVPGFRPGKVPPKIIDKRFGRETVLQEALNDAVPQLYGQAVEEKGVDVLGQPDLEVTKIEDGEEIAFTAEMDVRPEIEVPDYRGLPVTVESADVTPDDVEEQLDSLRERFASLKGANRPAADGDHVSIDLSATVDGEELEDGQASGMSYEVGQGSLIDGLDEALRGMSAGETATFTTELVGERAGQQAEVTVTVHSVKEKDLPELDDEFAQLASEFDTIGELRADMRSRLEQSKREQQAEQARDHALKVLLERVEVPVPEVSLNAELERRNKQVEQQLQSAGLTREQYLQSQGRTEEDFQEEVTGSAREAVQGQFVLDAVAVQEGLQVEEDELSQALVRTAQRMNVQPQQLAQHLTQSGQVQALASEVLRDKVLTLLLENAEITDESGQPVDGAALLRETQEQPGQPESAESESAESAPGEETSAGEQAEQAGGGSEAEGTSQPANAEGEAAESEPAEAESAEGPGAGTRAEQSG